MYQNGKFLCEPEEQDDDNSFASQSSDDYESSSEYHKLQESQDEDNISTQEVDIDKVLNQSTSNLSRSLLNALDGNDCSQLSPQVSFEKTRKRQLSECSSKEDAVVSSPDSIKKPLLDTAENDSTDF